MIAGVGKDHRLLAVKEFCYWSEVMHVGSGRLDRVDEAIVLVHADMQFYPEVPLIAFAGLVHLRNPLSILVHVPPARFACGLGRVDGCRDRGGIDDRALLHGHAVGLEVGFHCLKDLFAVIVLLQQVTEAEDRDFVRDLVTDKLNSRKTMHGGHLDERDPPLLDC